LQDDGIYGATSTQRVAQNGRTVDQAVGAVK
jgi:hypothetical protein